MNSLEIFLININRLAREQHLNSYRELAVRLGVTEAALKKWQNQTRAPSLWQLDRIADKNQIYTYSLIQRDGSLAPRPEGVCNNSRQALLDNLQWYFTKMERCSWRNRAALFFNFVSEDALKSYFRPSGFKTPPLKRLDEMGDAIGCAAYRLIKEGALYEERD